MTTDRIELADKAEHYIAKTLAALTASEAPNPERAAGKIDLAYELELIDYPRRDELMCQLMVIVSHRRKQLNAERNAAIIGSASE